MEPATIVCPNCKTNMRLSMKVRADNRVDNQYGCPSCGLCGPRLLEEDPYKVTMEAFWPNERALKKPELVCEKRDESNPQPVYAFIYKEDIEPGYPSYKEAVAAATVEAEDNPGTELIVVMSLAGVATKTATITKHGARRED